MPTIRFCGYTWAIKTGTGLGPGPNDWAPANVRVDDVGLHLRIDRNGDRWRCAEVSTLRSFGYGDYVFDIDGPIGKLDPNVVLGLFTYRNDLSELDIEFSRWGWEKAKAGQFVCQPAATRGNRFRFGVHLGGTLTRHTIAWRPGAVAFSSFEIYEDGSIAKTIAQWVYQGDDIPKASTEHAHINLWLNRGDSPLDDHEAEIVVRRFRFRKMPGAAPPPRGRDLSRE